MDTFLIITQLSNAGLKLEAVNGQLHVRPKELITDKMRAQIKHNKSEILNWLSQNIKTEWIEDTLEQSAISGGEHIKNVSWRYFYNSHYDDLHRTYANTLDDKIIVSMAMVNTAVDYVTTTYRDYYTWSHADYEARKQEAIAILVRSGLPQPMTLRECEDYFKQRKKLL